MSQYAQLREEICQIGRMLHQCGYVTGTDGNISIRLGDDTVLCTPTSISKGMMKPEDLVMVDMQGRLLCRGRKPTTELGMHLLFYQLRPEIEAVVHAHPPVATGFAAAEISLEEPLVSEVVITFGKIPLAPYATPGTAELAAVLEPLVPMHDAILMAHHGVVTCGRGVGDAYSKIETLEHYARIALVARQLGPLKPLPQEEIRKLMTIREKYMANQITPKVIPAVGEMKRGISNVQRTRSS
jgi:L-fuculose-phosphate aldolase